MSIFRSAFSKSQQDLLEGFLSLAQREARDKAKRRGTSGINTRNYYNELNTFINENFNVLKPQLLDSLSEKGGKKRFLKLRRGDLAYIKYKTTHPQTQHYDRNAVSLMLRYSKKTSTTYGLNFHYLPPGVRSEAIRKLIRQQINMPVRTLHSYLEKKRMEVYKIPYRLWSSFVMLPIEDFLVQIEVKGRRSKWKRVDKESIWRWTLNDRKKITGSVEPPAKKLRVDLDTRKDVQKDITLKIQNEDEDFYLKEAARLDRF